MRFIDVFNTEWFIALLLHFIIVLLVTVKILSCEFINFYFVSKIIADK